MPLKIFTAAAATTAMYTDDIRKLYRYMLNAWNNRSPGAFAALFTEDGSIVGFDGTAINTRAKIDAHLNAIFADHSTASYVGKVREVRFLTPDVALLRAIAGLVPPGQIDLNPDLNAIQSLVAVRAAFGWRIALFQNTPAALHMEPELREAITVELRELLP